jgi:hypothetical protein
MACEQFGSEEELVMLKQVQQAPDSTKKDEPPKSLNPGGVSLLLKKYKDSSKLPKSATAN